MHEIHFYKNSKGERPVWDYLNELANRHDKDSRIKLNKIRDYMKALEENGTAIGELKVKHLGGDIWELRPLRDRIFFVAWVNGSYVLLHHFMKQTQKTPVRELEQAKRELADLKERGLDDEQ